MPDRRERSLGLAYALAAYGSWGFFPIYLKAVSEVPVLELVCHRVVWASILLLALIWHQGHFGEVAAAFRQRRTLAVLGASTALIAANWFVYVFSVTHNRMVESSFGYYINPLVNVALGVLLLREKLDPLVRVAVAIAAGGVLWLGIHIGRPPWISLALAFSFALYGLLRKVGPVGPLIGLTVETLLLLPAAAAYLGREIATGRAAFLSGPRSRLPSGDGGPLTAIPLLCFTAAARRLPLSTIGFIQYISPTLQFLLAVVVYDEPFDRGRAAAFVHLDRARAVRVPQRAAPGTRAGRGRLGQRGKPDGHASIRARSAAKGWSISSCMSSTKRWVRAAPHAPRTPPRQSSGSRSRRDVDRASNRKSRSRGSPARCARPGPAPAAPRQLPPPVPPERGSGRRSRAPWTCRRWRGQLFARPRR